MQEKIKDFEMQGLTSSQEDYILEEARERDFERKEKEQD